MIIKVMTISQQERMDNMDTIIGRKNSEAVTKN